MSRTRARSDATSLSSLGSVDIAEVNEALRKSQRRLADASGSSSSCMTWLVPLLVVAGVGLLMYLLYNYSCGSDKYSNANNNGSDVVSSMANNDRGASSNNGQVIDLDGDRLEIESSDKPIIVAFLAQGCGWCQKVKPNFIEAAKMSPKRLHTLYAHSKNGMDKCKQFGVKGFPTILYIHKGRIIAEYQGDRSPADIVRWAQSLN